MRRLLLLPLVTLLPACGVTDPVTTSELLPTGPSFSSAQMTAEAVLAPTGHLANSCPDEAPVWHSKNSETNRGSFTAEFRPLFNVDTYEVEVWFSQDGLTPPRLARSRWAQNGTEIRLVPWQGSGRYYAQVRAKNRCDRSGRWSAPLTVYMGNDDPQGALYCPWDLRYPD